MDKEFLSQIDQLQDLIPEAQLRDEILICECFCVNVADIRATFCESKKVELSTLQEKFNLGGGCQGCLKEFENWVSKIF